LVIDDSLKSVKKKGRTRPLSPQIKGVGLETTPDFLAESQKKRQPEPD
jgi:hypothetical protein